MPTLVIRTTGPDSVAYYQGGGKWSETIAEAKRYTNPMEARRVIVEQEKQFKASAYKRELVKVD